MKDIWQANKEKVINKKKNNYICNYSYNNSFDNFICYFVHM